MMTKKKNKESEDVLYIMKAGHDCAARRSPLVPLPVVAAPALPSPAVAVIAAAGTAVFRHLESESSIDASPSRSSRVLFAAAPMIATRSRHNYQWSPDPAACARRSSATDANVPSGCTLTTTPRRLAGNRGGRRCLRRYA